MANGEDRPAAAVQSVDRALLVLESLAKSGQAGVTEIAAELGVHKSTVSRLIAVLESRGYVEQVSGRGKYRLGFSIARLARASRAHLDLGKLSQDICDGLTEAVGETSNLAILADDRVINIVESIAPAEISLRTWVGQTCPPHATSSGKALLSGLSAQEVRDHFAGPFEAYTPNTVVDVEALLRQLDGVRERGWASVSEELEVGLNAVAAPVYDDDARVVAAVSVSGPSYRLGDDRFEEVAKQTIAAADAVSRRLGWVEPGDRAATPGRR
ncbi:IclR family transcriptional regulator [Mycolicibacterium arseniciresistens]|uniref:IclR family transcriptional regulator n=1 Tax=Mycolicibacterium arseniciresistens TaxID=3062257 RepID=A0ABT8UCT6_9MYCO|nr:IclR family transcriptional regulator [Mycolicibacterium arseniciresistens]MDO3635596.1 IclR family transcriptional regulator [Mycolicibacterium arseniciresistens]